MSHLRLVASRSNLCPDASGKSGDHPALEAFQGEVDYIMRTFRRLGVSPNDVEDLAHEVFLILYQGWDRYDPARPFRAYVFGIAFRVACNHNRKRKREIRYAVMETSDDRFLPDQELEARQVRALVLRALKRVPMQRRAVLIMHDIDMLPMADVAANLSIYRFTGYSRLHKARKEFAAALASLLGAGEP
jgi:RNA polymerase sigma-70 factor, ECF subfamily